MTDPTPTPPQNPPGQRNVNRYGQRGALTQERHDAIVLAIRAGAYMKTAAASVGISDQTLSGWMKKGREGLAAQTAVQDAEPELTEAEALDRIPEGLHRYMRFVEAVTQAEPQAELAAVAAWRGAFRDDWRAARDYLQRRHPDRWAATTRISMSNEEAERRLDRAVEEVMLALGGDTPGGDLDADVQAAFDRALSDGDDPEEDTAEGRTVD